MSSTGSKSPQSPKSQSTSSKRRNQPHTGTITMTPNLHSVPIHRIQSEEEETVTRNGADVELMTRNTANTTTSQMEQLSLGESQMIAMQSSADEDTITPSIN